MTTKKPDGGPAFPAPGYVNQGMSLRDYFAAKAMPVLISMCQDGDGAWNNETVAQCAYALADAMMVERE